MEIYEQRPDIIIDANDSNIIPLDYALEPLQRKDLIKGHTRVMLLMLMLTGCRVRELDNMYASRVLPCAEAGGYLIYFKLGKNQRQHRKEVLPKWYVENELIPYRKDYARGDKLFGVSSVAFQRYFLTCRKKLSKAWNEMKPYPVGDGKWQLGYCFQLKGYRKLWATMQFRIELEKWNNPDFACIQVSRKLHHSSKFMTSDHYIQATAKLGIENSVFTPTMPMAIQKYMNQRSILNWSQ